MSKLNYIKHEVKNWLKERRVRSQNIDDEYKSIFHALDTDGYAILENYWDKDQCAQALKEADAALSEYEDHCWKDDKGADQRLYGAERVFASAEGFWKDPFLQSIAETYAELKPVKGFTMLNRILFKEENNGSGGGWHRDTATVRQFKAIIYLSDVTEDSGPFEFLPGSHTTRSLVWTEFKLGLKEHQNRFSEEEIAKALNALNLEKVQVIGKRGTLLLVDTRGIHRGAPLSSGQRYAMTNYYLPEVGAHFKKLMFDKDA